MQQTESGDFGRVLNSGLSPEQADILSELTLMALGMDRYDDLFALVLGFFDHIDAGDVTCAIFDNQDYSLVGFSSSFRQELVDDVTADDLLPEDPLLDWIAHSTEPALLGYGFGVTPPWQEGRRANFVKHLENNGYYGLLFQPVRLAGGPYSAAITIATELQPDKARQYLNSHSTLILLAAKLMAVLACHLFQPRDIDDSWRARRALPLTGREHDVVSALVRGDRPEQIAHDLNIKPVTVHMHVASARQKLGARTREQLVSIALKQRLI